MNKTFARKSLRICHVFHCDTLNKRQLTCHTLCIRNAQTNFVAPPTGRRILCKEQNLVHTLISLAMDHSGMI